MRTYIKPKQVIEVYQVHKDTMNDENLPSWLDKLLIHGYVDGLYYGYDKKFFGLVLHSSRVARVGEWLGIDKDTRELLIMQESEFKHYQEI